MGVVAAALCNVEEGGCVETPEELDEDALGVAGYGIRVGDETADVVSGNIELSFDGLVTKKKTLIHLEIPIVLVAPDVQREEPDEASDLHEEVDKDSESRVEGERVDGRHYT